MWARECLPRYADDRKRWCVSIFERLKRQQINAIRVGLRSNNDEEFAKEALYERVYGKSHPYGTLTLGHAKNAATLKFSPKGDDTRDFSELKGAVTKSIRDVGRVGFAARRAALAVSSHCSGGAFRAGVAALGGSNTKCKRLRPFYTITSLVLSLDTQHVVLAINAAKGGDPMSHGSAGGSVKFVRELRF